MLLWNRQGRLPRGPGVDLGRAFRASAPRVVTRGQVGFLGYFAGPNVHVIDIFALGDPLLARLPAAPGWRIGHFERSVPDGYVETIQTGTNVIRDPDISARYTRLKLITQGPIWSRSRSGAVRTIVDR
jgi:arabinofuranosyltransferase